MTSQRRYPADPPSGRRKISTCIFMASLAVVDSGVLLDLLAYIVFIEWNVGEGVINRVMVHRVTYYLVEFLGQLSGWILAGMTIDRFIAIRFPLKAFTFCTVKRARKVVFGLTLVIGTVNANILFTYQVKRDPVFGLERFVEDFPAAPVVEKIVSWWELIAGTVVPFFVLIIFNCLIIWNVRSASKFQRQMTYDQKDKMQALRKAKAEAHLTRMLLLVCIAYLVCSVPVRIYLLENTGSFNYQDPEWFIQFNVGYWYGCIGWYMNYAINFYLYCIAGGRKFRQDVLEILCCGRRRQLKRNSEGLSEEGSMKIHVSTIA
ncbi:kiSS-1 receptor-like isoform X2 [Lineus longissimus]|uniref:kiSS-1 receptor-like isoform X2 n=1 Tax=Lineus longissimus TaxID=88925 RepID=UPI00315CDC1D